MAPTSSPASCRRWIASGALVAAAALALVSAAAAQEQAPACPRVRPADRRAAALLASAVDQSPTVAALVDTLNHSAVYVHVATGLARVMGLHGKCGALTLGAETPVGRYIRVSIVVPDLDVSLIAALAHELQHAAEVAGAPEVRDTVTLERFYQARGFRKPDGTYCTREAVAAGLTARAEFARAVRGLPAAR